MSEVSEKTDVSPSRAKSLANLRPPWKSGVSPNPGGRPKALVELEAYASEYTREAIDTFVEVMRDKGAAAVARLRAGELIVERAFGKPRQQVALDHTSNGEAIRSLDDLKAVVAEIEAIEKSIEGKESILQ
jgi:hypothetical protein